MAMESNDESRSPDLELVRPDRNQGCTSSHYSSPSRVDRDDVSGLSNFELEDRVERFNRLIDDCSMKDNNAKLRLLLFKFMNELARRGFPKQTGSPAIQGEASKRLQSKPDFDRKMFFSNTETQPSVSDLQLCRSSPQRVDLTIALDCESEDRIPLPASLKGDDDVDEIQDLNKSPHTLDTEVCSGCCESATSQNKKSDQVSPCSLCKLGEISGSTKRSQQVIGDTYDTALELSDDEDQKEVAAWEPSSSCNMLKRKCQRIGSKILKNDSKFLYPSSSDQEAVEVRYADLSYLAPAEFLNDTVIDFYIKFIQLNLLEDNDRLHRFHFFSCFFHKKLTSSRAAGHCSQVIFTALKSYLMAERRHIRQRHGALEEINIEPSKAILKRKPVPLQDNDWDCGLFTLYYIQKFVTEVDVKGFDNLFGRDWFDPIEASGLRETILNILESLLTEKPTQS